MLWYSGGDTETTQLRVNTCTAFKINSIHPKYATNMNHVFGLFTYYSFKSSNQAFFFLLYIFFLPQSYFLGKKKRVEEQTFIQNDNKYT